MYLDEFHTAVASLTRELALVSASGELDLYSAGCLKARIEEVQKTITDADPAWLASMVQSGVSFSLTCPGGAVTLIRCPGTGRRRRWS